MRAVDDVEAALAAQDEPLSRVLGTRTAAALARLGLRTVGDLLAHYPRRWAPPGQLTDLTHLREREHVSVIAQVAEVRVRDMRARQGAMLQAVVTDGRGRLHLTFFAKHRGALRRHEERLAVGATGLFTGDLTRYRGELQLAHPDYQLVGVDVDDEAEALVEAGRPLPIYPSAAGVPTWQIQRCVRTVLGPLTDADLPDPVPADVRAARRLVGLRQALVDVHEPFSEQQVERGVHRLRYSEAFVLQAELARRRATTGAQDAVARPPVPGGLLEAFDARLPFTLTSGQRAVGAQIQADLARAHPMQRLLQGEVGSGKTVVALRAMLQVIDAGGQAALLAPTEVLAGQHAQTVRALLGDLADAGALWAPERSTGVALLTGSQGAPARRQALADAAGGRAGIVIGTHALLSEQVQFADLGLVVVDEQHRFGVQQRDVLRGKARVAPHVLVMTATPIPRTVAMTVFGDLEVSTLREVPPGRATVSTHVVPADRPAWLARTWQRVREEVDAGGRVYVVCPRIDGDGVQDADQDLVDLVEDPDQAASGDDGGDDGAASGGAAVAVRARRPLRAVHEVAESLRALPELAGVPVGELHGRLPPEDKDRTLADFTAGRVPVLVCTTVIEVGVDVTQATAMVVLDADRFGLSQLHQLRGRVGRGAQPGVCLLVADAAPGSPAAARLDLLAGTTDGFELAAADLRLRREGDVLGAAQSGTASSLRLLRVTRDVEIIEAAREDARAVVAADPALGAHAALRAAIERTLAGDREEFIDRS